MTATAADWDEIVPETYPCSHVMNRLLGGWELSAITTLASGTLYSVLNANNTPGIHKEKNHD